MSKCRCCHGKDCPARNPEPCSYCECEGEGRSDTAIGSASYKAAKEAAQARGWVMEPSVISAMLAAAVPFIREAVAAEIESELEGVNWARTFANGLNHAAYIARSGRDCECCEDEPWSPYTEPARIASEVSSE